MDRVDPPHAADERTTLASFLDYYRATMLTKVAGLTEEQARWSPVPTGTSLFGLLVHLVDVERWWFARVIAGLDTADLWPGGNDRGWAGPEGATLADVVAAYERECARSRSILDGTDLDHVVTGDRAGRSVRWILVHMIEETARHAGHADIVREQIDGAVGD